MGYYCNKCHKSISAGIYHYSTENYGKALCRDHQENVLRIRKNKSGYRQFFDRRANKWKFTHRRVAEKNSKVKYSEVMKFIIKTKIKMIIDFKTLKYCQGKNIENCMHKEEIIINHF